MKTYPAPSTLLSITNITASSATIDSPTLLLKKDDFSLSLLVALSSPLLISPSSSSTSLSSDSSATSDTSATSSSASTIDSLSPPLHQQRIKTRQRKRSVRFLPKVAVRTTISRHTMTQEEKCNAWLQEHEFKDIKLKRRQEQEDDKWGDRINGMTKSQESYRKKSYRFGASEEVFTEQEEQYLNNYVNEEAIAYAYSNITHECQFLAEQIALQHREDIEDYIYNDYETI